jgi:hypothetical protein
MLVGNSKRPSASSRGDTGQVTVEPLRDSVVNSQVKYFSMMSKYDVGMCGA